MPQAHGNAQVEHLQATVAELTQRLAKAESKLVQLEMDKHERGTAAVGAATQADIARLNTRLEGISRKLAATPGYNAGNLFKCSSCGASGQLAIPIKCTHCGEEGWWGWWPREKLEE
jgi:hypothetical protein